MNQKAAAEPCRCLFGRRPSPSRAGGRPDRPRRGWSSMVQNSRPFQAGRCGFDSRHPLQRAAGFGLRRAARGACRSVFRQCPLHRAASDAGFAGNISVWQRCRRLAPAKRRARRIRRLPPPERPAESRRRGRMPAAVYCGVWRAVCDVRLVGIRFAFYLRGACPLRRTQTKGCAKTDMCL